MVDRRPSSPRSGTIRLHGELDSTNVETLVAATDEALEQGVVLLTVDLEGVDFMNASVLGALVVARARCRRQGAHLRVRCNKPSLRRMRRGTVIEAADRPRPELR